MSEKQNTNTVVVTSFPCLLSKKSPIRNCSEGFTIPTVERLSQPGYLEIVQLTVCAGRDVETGDVEDDLLAVCGQHPPLALVSFLERRRVRAGGGGVQRRVLGRPELGCSFLKLEKNNF